MQDLTYKALIIAINAGKIIMKHYGRKDFQAKDDNSPLTLADMESNSYITKELERISSYKVCSEECVLPFSERRNLEYFWLIDPLDGTKDFLAGNGNFTINIALIRHNRPILGIVYAPSLYEAYIGELGKGSFSYNIARFRDMVDSNCHEIEWLKKHKIALSKENIQAIYGENLEFLDADINSAILDSKGLIICDSIFHSTEKTKEFIESIEARGRTTHILKRGSSLKICALASQIADMYPRMNGTSEWDTAASEIILQETGGYIYDMQTKTKGLEYNTESMRNNYFVAYSKSYLA